MKFRYNCENFAIVAKFLYNSEIAPVSPTCSSLVPVPSSCYCLLFLQSKLDEIEDKSYALDVNQLNFDIPSLI